MAVAVLGAVLALLSGNPRDWLAASLWTRVGWLAGLVGAGVAAYFGTLLLLGFRLRDFDRKEVPGDGQPVDFGGDR